MITQIKDIYDARGTRVRGITTTYENNIMPIGGVERGAWMFVPYNVLMVDEVSVVRTTTDILGTGQVTTSDCIKFNQYGQVSEVSRSSGDGPVMYVNNQYVTELSDAERTGLHGAMIEFNVTSIPLKSVESVREQGSTSRKTLRGYKNLFVELSYPFSGTCFTVKQTGQRVTELTNPVDYTGFNFDAYLSTERERLAYDDKCRLISSTNRNGVTTTYVWGYEHSLQVAEIVNATPGEVEAALGTGMLEAINAAEYLDAAMIAALDALRVALPDASVTTCTHEPHVGITSITDPSGRKVFHEYDEFYRLKRTKDDKGNVISEQEYSNNH